MNLSHIARWLLAWMFLDLCIMSSAQAFPVTKDYYLYEEATECSDPDCTFPRIVVGTLRYVDPDGSVNDNALNVSAVSNFQIDIFDTASSSPIRSFILGRDSVSQFSISEFGNNIELLFQGQSLIGDNLWGLPSLPGNPDRFDNTIFDTTHGESVHLNAAVALNTWKVGLLPEPGTLALVGFALGACIFGHRQRSTAARRRNQEDICERLCGYTSVGRQWRPHWRMFR